MQEKILHSSAAWGGGEGELEIKEWVVHMSVRESEGGKSDVTVHCWRSESKEEDAEITFTPSRVGNVDGYVFFFDK